MKYLVFGWDGDDRDGPANRFYGTTEDSPSKGEEEWVSLSDNLLFDREYKMTVEKDSFGRNSMAYFPILSFEEYRESELIRT